MTVTSNINILGDFTQKDTVGTKENQNKETKEEQEQTFRKLNTMARRLWIKTNTKRKHNDPTQTKGDGTIITLGQAE